MLVSPEEHKWLSEIMTNTQEEDAIIAGGVVTDQGVRVSGRPEDFDLLLGSIAFDANHTSSTKRRRALYAIYDRVEEMVADATPE
jgi:phosphopantothenate synthetase